MGLSLRQAAELCGASRSTIHRALQSGKLSGRRTEEGAWSIDAAELARVFPWDVSGTDQRDTADRGRDGDADKGADRERIAVQAIQITMLQQQLEREQATVEDLRRRLDRAEDRVLALTAPLPSAKPEEPRQGSLWGRLRHVLKGQR